MFKTDIPPSRPASLLTQPDVYPVSIAAGRPGFLRPLLILRDAFALDGSQATSSGPAHAAANDNLNMT